MTGTIVYTQDPWNIIMENIIADTWDVFEGFSFNLGWNYPEAFLTPVLQINNMTLFVSSDNLTSYRPIAFLYLGPGNISISNLDLTNIYTLEKSGKTVFRIAQEPDCTPDDGRLQVAQIDNVVSSLRSRYKIQVELKTCHCFHKN